MKKKNEPRSELANNFLTIFDGLTRNSPLATEEKLVEAFHLLDEKEKCYVLNHKDNLDNSLLIDAVDFSQESLAILLVNLGFNINHFNCNGKSVLIHAVKSRLYDLIDVLLEKGVDVNYARQDKITGNKKAGSTALMFAAEDGQYEVVKKLVEHGADINYINDLGQCAILYTAKATEDHFNCFKYLIEQPNIVVNGFDKLGNNLLESIVKFATIDFLPLALDKGAYDPQVYGNLCLHLKRDMNWGRGNKNVKEKAIEMLEFIPKFMNAKKLNEELSNKFPNQAKKIKI